MAAGALAVGAADVFSPAELWAVGQDFSSGGAIYDVVFDAVGKSGYERSLKSLKRGGVYVRVAGTGGTLSFFGGMLRGIWTSLAGRVKVIGGTANGSVEDARCRKELIEAGKLRTVIDRRYPLDAIAEAFRYVEETHPQGKVIITMV